MTSEEREHAELARRSMHGYRTYGAYATTVLGAVTMIRETPVGDKTALTRRLVQSRFSRLGEAALTAKYLVALAPDAEFAELRRLGGPTFSFTEGKMLTNRIRAKRQHFLAICPKEVTRRANELLRRDPEQAKTNGEGLTTGWFRGFARRNGKFQDPAERQILQEVIASHTSPRDTIEEWLKVKPRIPRASDLWDLPGGLCGAAALRVMRVVDVPAEARPQHRSHIACHIRHELLHIISIVLQQVKLTA